MTHGDELTVDDYDWGEQGDPAAAGQVESIGETFPAFAQRLRDRQTPPDIVPELIPGRGITMIHGQPRALKTWVAMEVGRASATADAAFGLERLRVRSPLRTWYVTEEDPELDVRDRFACLFAGHDQPPAETLHVSVHRTIDLDDPEWCARVVQYGREKGIQFTLLDPIRSLSAAVDQGPRDVKPLVQFLRRYIRLTGSPVLLVHHDVKPLNGRPDERDKPQRMSGGGIFSATDAPIHAELVGDVGSRTLLAPARYKFSVTPNPFLVSIESNDPKRPTWVRIEGAESTSAAASELVLHQKIRDYLLDHPGISGNKIATAIRGNKARVLSALDEMLKSGDADFYQVGQAKHWTILTGGAEAQR